jgi:hypothetical protein
MARLAKSEHSKAQEIRNVACHLNELANRLEFADTPEAFIAAVEANQGAWRALHAMPQLAGAIPLKFMRAALSLTRVGVCSFDDHKVELLIDLDRRVSAAIAASVQH